MSKVRDLVISPEKDIPQTRKGGKLTLKTFRRDGPEEIKLAQKENHQKELAKIDQEASLLRVVEYEQEKEEIEQNIKLSEFFSIVSKEKSKNLEKIKEDIKNPESDLANLFKQLETVHKEVTKVSEELSEEKILTEDDQNKLEVFSNLVDSLNTPIKSTVEPEEVVDEIEKITAFDEPVDESEPEPIVEITPVPEAKEETVERTGNIIHDIVNTLDEMGQKTEVKEEIDQITVLRGEFDKFKKVIQRHISNQDHSGAGSGEVRLEFLDDIQRSTAKVDGKFLKYSSSDSKWIGADASGSGSSAADDISAGDAAVTLTTTSGNITIDAAANNTDIIFKGTDATSDITMLTLDGSEAGAATFNNAITSGAVITSGAGLLIANDGTIGSASDTNSITIASDGVVTMDQIPVFSAGINVSGGTIAGTLATAAQTNITSLGTLTALTIDDVAINGKVVTMTGSSSDTAVFTAGTNGTLSIVTTDAAAAAANIQITADGTVDIDSAGVLTLDSGAAINIEPAAGSAILLDSTISVDAGVVTGATSITSTAFVGDITGDVTGNVSGTAATVTTAAQTNITSLGTLTALTVDNVVINGATIGHGDDTDLMTVADGVLTVAGNIKINAEDAFIFEGATADVHETTFSVTDPTADRTIVLPDTSGQVQVIPPITLNGTDGSSTDAGDHLVQNTAANDGDQILYEDATSDVIAVFASHGITLAGVGWNAFQLNNNA